jgi:ferritin-like metal-binding protein YciE
VVIARNDETVAWMLRRVFQNPKTVMITNLEHLYFDQIRDLYGAEIQLLRMLPQMAAHASCAELRKVFENHVQETHRHCARLCKISERNGVSQQTVSCESMHTLLREVTKYLTETVPGDVRDGILIAAGKRIEHYEIAGYEVAGSFADCLGYLEDEKLLRETQEEEAAASVALGRIAREGVFLASANESVSLV